MHLPFISFYLLFHSKFSQLRFLYAFFVFSPLDSSLFQFDVGLFVFLRNPCVCNCSIYITGISRRFSIWNRRYDMTVSERDFVLIRVRVTSEPLCADYLGSSFSQILPDFSIPPSFSLSLLFLPSLICYVRTITCSIIVVAFPPIRLLFCL